MWMVTAATKLKTLAPWKTSYDKPRECIKKQRHHFVNKGPYSQSYGFSSSHVWMWELDHKGGWALKNWCFQTLVLNKPLVNPLDSKEIKLVNPKGNQPWTFIGRTDTKVPILWPPDAKSWLIGKDPDAGKDWRQEEKETTDDKMIGWHYWLSGHEFKQTPGNREQGNLAAAVHGVAKNQTWFSNWKTTTVTLLHFSELFCSLL